jgi:hypothetical protein
MSTVARAYKRDAGGPGLRARAARAVCFDRVVARQVPQGAWQFSHATQFGSAVHALLIAVSHGPGPPSPATCAGPLRQLMHAVVGFCGVAAQMLVEHSE